MVKLVHFLLLALLPFGTFADTQYDLAIQNVTVIDAMSEPQLNRTVLVSGDQIQSVVPADTTYTATRILDGTGRYLIPGLWDMHVHIVYEPELIEAMPDLFLDYGITSVRDTGALLDRIAPEVKRWDALKAHAPDLYYSGPLLDGSLVVYDGEGRPEIGIANNSVEAALANFKRLQDADVDLIKIYELVSPEVFAALVEAANEAGLPIAAHVPLSMTADTAGPKVNSMEHLRNIEIACAAGADTLHSVRLSEFEYAGDKSGYELRSHLHSTQRAVALQTADPDSEQCQAVIRSLAATIQVPTLRLNTITLYSPLNREDWSEHLERIPESIAKRWFDLATFYAGLTSEPGNRMSRWSLDLVNALNQQSVPIGAGTDTPIGQAIPGYSLHTELERLVDAGLSPRDALLAATVRPAEFFDLQETKGRILSGMEADLVLLEANPLDDIRNTRTVLHVISDGVVVR